MNYHNIYTSVGCNRTCECADWNSAGLVAFGACHSIAILDTNYAGSCKITQTFIKHTARVNTVKWIRRKSAHPEKEFISGADDNLAIIWNVDRPDEGRVLQGHKGGVTALDTIEAGGSLLVVTAASDSSIRLWEVSQSDITTFQEISLKTGFCFAVRFARAPASDHLLLAYSTDDNKIRLLTKFSKEFVQTHQLLGHENWVRGLDFATTDNTELLLASCSQDTFIRLWKIAPHSEKDQYLDDNCLLQVPTGSVHVEDKSRQLSFIVSLESVLLGHEDWVYAVHWNRTNDGLQLLSASIDKTMIIWTPGEDEVWCEKVRVGEVGGGMMGFYGGKFATDGKSIVGYGYLGSFHIWRQSAEDEKLWVPGLVVSGHFCEVRDICWEPQGEFLFSTSSDQTTRVHAPCKSTQDGQTTWHELARPQVHGYDMQCLAALGRYKFASGAEEKVIRVFQAPMNFVRSFRGLCNVPDDPEGDEISKNAPQGASLPSLGLSNKGIQDAAAPATATDGDELVIKLYPPQEETLMAGTLWPEIQKLYGHGFEIFSLTSSSDGKYLASTCKASSAEHANILLWDTTTWKQIQKLPAHQLTVTQMSFSRDGRFLLAVSRDRRWSLFENKSNGTAACNFELVAMMDKKSGVHTRIIWSCDWSHDSKYFVTSSRDGKLAVWTTSGSSEANVVNPQVAASMELKNQSITACAFGCEHYEDANYLVALGMETGVVKVCRFDGAALTELITLDRPYAHHLAVKRLRFRPNRGRIELASCGEDQIIRIYEFVE